jgi:hypothetical protein
MVCCNGVNIRFGERLRGVRRKLAIVALPALSYSVNNDVHF